MDDWVDYLFWGGVGAAGGAVATITLWAVFSKMLDKQFDEASAELLTRGEAELQRELRATLDREIPARVGAEIDQKFREVGITRQTGTQLAAVLAAADRIGLIGLRGGLRRTW